MEFVDIRITEQLLGYLEESNQIVLFEDREFHKPYWNISPSHRRALLHLDETVYTKPYREQFGGKTEKD